MGQLGCAPAAEWSVAGGRWPVKVSNQDIGSAFGSGHGWRYEIGGRVQGSVAPWGPRGQKNFATGLGTLLSGTSPPRRFGADRLELLRGQVQLPQPQSAEPHPIPLRVDRLQTHIPAAQRRRDR